MAAIRIGNGKSKLRNLMARFANANGSRGFTVDDAVLGVRCLGLRFTRRQVATALSNMNNDEQLQARSNENGRRFYEVPGAAF